MKLDQTAVLFESGWALSDWIIPVVALVVALAFLWFARAVTAWLTEMINNSIAVAVIAGLLFIASSLATVGITLTLMRHAENRAYVWLLFALLAVIASALLIRGYMADNKARRYADWASAAVIAWAALSGLAVDAVNRAAASIPTSVPTFLTIVVVALIAIFLATRRK